MKKTRDQIFRINSPYGVIIRISDLRYSWFNREYKEQYDDTNVYLPWEQLYKFEGKLKSETVMEKLKDFVDKNKEYGMTYEKEVVAGFGYLRVWLYNDANFPFRLGKEDKVKMNQYEKRLLDLKQII